ncbi:SH3 domain-containing protein [Phytohabitans rumicis]
MKRHLLTATRVFLVGVTLASTVLVAGTAQAAPGASGSAVEAPAICTDHRYVVTGDGVAVRTAPGLSATILRRKYRGDIVVVPCVPIQHADGYEWVAVRLGTGGIGWMARIYLQRL